MGKCLYNCYFFERQSLTIDISRLCSELTVVGDTSGSVELQTWAITPGPMLFSSKKIYIYTKSSFCFVVLFLILSICKHVLYFASQWTVFRYCTCYLSCDCKILHKDKWRKGCSNLVHSLREHYFMRGRYGGRICRQLVTLNS